MKHVLEKLVLGVICGVSIIVAAPSVWDGSVDDSWYRNNRYSGTYLLTKASQLAGLAKLVNEGTSFKGRTIVLGADIFLNDTTGAGAGTWEDNLPRCWTPIGKKNSPFKGEFYGSIGKENHRIFGLYINSSSDYAGFTSNSLDNYVGLFGNTDSAKIFNLDILEGKIISKEYVGMLIGKAYKTEISNIHVKAEIRGSNHIGGLVGAAGLGSIIDSYFEGHVTGAEHVGGLVGGGSEIIGSHSFGTVSGGDWVGGLSGSGSSVTDSYFKGDVNGINFVGGLAGQGSIANSFSEGNVTGAEGVGGLAGNGSITSSFFEGKVSGVNYVGGLVGNGSVYDSYSKGTVSGNNYVGGLAGETYWSESVGNFYNSYFQGNVVASGNFAGGLVGLSVHDQIAGEVVLENTYAIANVEGFDYVGGLVGCDSVKKIYNHDSFRISNCYSQGNIRGNSYVGGIVGKYSYNSEKRYDYEFNLVACHHTGNVFGDSNYVGGIIGINDAYRGSIDSSFHNGGDVRGMNYVGGLIGYYDSVSVLNESYSEGNVFGSGSYVGGLVGCIENIKLLNNSYSKGDVTGKGSYVGGVCGYSQGDNVDYIYHSSGNVNGDGYVGGLFGEGSFWQVNHSYHSEGDVYGSKYVGGLVGWTGPIRDESKKGVLKNSFSIGDIHGRGLYTGGMVGHLSYEDIDSSYHIGNVSNEGMYTGGLVGYCYGYISGNNPPIDALEIRNSYVIGDYVKGEDYVGGVAGRLFTCNISSSYYDGDSVVGKTWVGGLVGESMKIVTDSYSTADVSGVFSVGGLVGYAKDSVKNSYALGDVSGTSDIGGLVGSSADRISTSWANGNVSGDSKVGGLVGDFSVSYYEASITDSYAKGNVTGVSHVGGLVGYGHAGGDTRSHPVHRINRSYVSGSVNVVGDDAASAGCIVGYMYADSSKWGSCGWNLDKSYYDSDRCNLGVYGEFHRGKLSDIKSQAKTTADMQIQSTFEQWNFTDIWAISENSYPYHQKFSNFLPNADVETDALSDYMYDGLPKKPKVKSVNLLGNELTEGKDYTVEYKNNLNAGVARIKVCGINAYSGCKVVKFEIAAIPIEITIDPIMNVVYTGEKQTPEVKVYNEKSLMENEKYIVEYKNNVNVGEASVIVTLKGNYSGVASTNFTIKKATPVISQNPMARDVLIGESLESSSLLEGISDVEGTFVWKNPEIKPALENEGYAVEFVPTDANNYNSVEIIVPIKVRNVAYIAVRLGNKTLDSDVVIEGNTYVLPTVPDSVGYNFMGFYKGVLKVGNPGDEIVVNENTIIEAVYEIKTFVVKFVNDGTELQSEELAYGSLPKYKGDSPVKNATAKWTYSFKGWNPEISSVTESVTYTAVIDSFVNKYEISFNDYDGSVLKTAVKYDYGTSLTNIVRPKKTKRQETAKYIYTFKNWDPVLADVTEDVVYIAKYDSIIRDYQIVFVNGNDELQSENISYGEVPAYDGVLPTKQATAQWTYIFKGWNPAVSPVVSSATYTAVFDSVVNKYEVVFKDYDGSILKKAVHYDYGTRLTNIDRPTIPTRPESAKCSYTFKGWTPALADVIDNVVYTAEYDSTIQSYTITFVSESKEIQSGKVAYGTTPSYKGETPTKNVASQFNYSFKGWSPSITPVSKNMTYTAVFDSTVKKYTVTFMNGSKTLQVISVAHGSLPRYTGEIPTMASTKNYSYEFAGWNPKIENAAGEATYQAVFDSTKLTEIKDCLFSNMEMSVSVNSRTIQIAVAPIGSAYAILDMQGRVLKNGRVESANFNLAMSQAGHYLVRIGGKTQRVNVK